MVNGGIGLRHLHLPFCSTPTRFALSVHVAFCGREVGQDYVRLKQIHKPLTFWGNLEMLKYAGYRAHHIELYLDSLI